MKALKRKGQFLELAYPIALPLMNVYRINLLAF